jgi:hypothetical protein
MWHHNRHIVVATNGLTWLCVFPIRQFISADGRHIHFISSTTALLSPKFCLTSRYEYGGDKSSEHDVRKQRVARFSEDYIALNRNSF